MICTSRFRRARRIDGAANALLAGPWGPPGRDRPGHVDGVAHGRAGVAAQQHAGAAQTISVGAAPAAVLGSAAPQGSEDGARDLAGDLAAHRADGLLNLPLAALGGLLRLTLATLGLLDGLTVQIGRASCRERV